MHRWFIVALAPLLLASAFAAEPAAAQDPARPGEPGALSKCTRPLAAERSRIWIYRTAPKSIGVPPDIVVDNRRYESLLPRIGYTIDVAPGPHTVKLAYHKETLEIDVQAGQQVFVRFDLDPAIFFGKGFYPVLVEPDTARGELRLHAGIDFDCVRDE
jgi:hypothetical protein